MPSRLLVALIVIAAFPAALSCAALGLLLYRQDLTGDPMFSFMAWNLILAWCPVLFAAAGLWLHRAGAPVLLLAPVLLGWLLFLPNSPYLVTDLIHVRLSREDLRVLDQAMLGTFAAAGVTLGCGALLLVHIILRERLGSFFAWLGVSAACFASGAGIYLGRVLRLNSWDAVTDPLLLPRIAASRLQDPLGNPVLLAVVAGFAVLLLLAYIPLYWAVETYNPKPRQSSFPSQSRR
jgi:uncharacterized membrane protein